MTRLSLHSRDENPKLSIRLLVGQYCTVGSSAAADYQFRGKGIDPVHCRIGCRPTGGYIECLDLNSRIVVNGVSKDRSRLTHGNTLQIGSVAMDVDMPDLDFSSRDFEVNFEEDAPTAKVSDAVNYDHQSDETNDPATSTSNSGANRDANPDANSTEREPAEAKSHDQPVIENGDAANADSNQLPPADSSDPDSNRSQSTSGVPAPIKNDPPLAATSPKRSVTFEFDSADPDDVDLSQSELDEMTQTSPIENVMGSVDLESELESGSEHFQQAADSEQLPEAEADLEADLATEPTDRHSLHLEGGLYTDKHWKWTNSRAIAALRRMLDFDDGLKVYQCDIKQITSVEIEEFSVRWFKKQKCVVYLISHLEDSEINALVRAKRWDERIGHPQAVTMFLALSPRRIVSDFFASIQACLLFSEDLELLRESDSLDV